MLTRSERSTEAALNNLIMKCEARKEIAEAIERVKERYIEREYNDNDEVISIQITDNWHDTGYGELIIGQCDRILEELLKFELKK